VSYGKIPIGAFYYCIHLNYIVTPHIGHNLLILPIKTQIRFIHGTFTLTRRPIPYLISSTSRLLQLPVASELCERFSIKRRANPLYQSRFIMSYIIATEKKILRELGCLELYNHHNLITLVKAFELKHDPHTITIIMAPWAPSTLWNFLLATNARRKTEFLWFEPNLISLDRCIYRIMLDIIAAMAFLHERSIKHKDIKPQNILMYREATGTIRPIITDVGESKVYRAGAATEPKRSSYEYLAPE
jgi:serine/threonine protein kinase